MSRLIFGQKNLPKISFTEAATPWCARLCRVSKTARRCVIGTRRRGESVKVSQIICMSQVVTGRYVNLQVAYSDDDRPNVSRRGWSKAIVEGQYPKVMTELIERRDKASAVTFCSTEICRISLVNCKMKVSSFAR